MKHENLNPIPMAGGPDKRLIKLFSSPDTEDTAAVFFFFKKSGELVVEGRTGNTEESRQFLRDVMFVLDAWISENKNFND